MIKCATYTILQFWNDIIIPEPSGATIKHEEQEQLHQPLFIFDHVIL